MSTQSLALYNVDMIDDHFSFFLKYLHNVVSFLLSLKNKTYGTRSP